MVEIIGINIMYSNTDERLGMADSDEGIVDYALLTPPDIPITIWTEIMQA
jgi:hypothetical protein